MKGFENVRYDALTVARGADETSAVRASETLAVHGYMRGDVWI